MTSFVLVHVAETHTVDVAMEPAGRTGRETAKATAECVEEDKPRG